MENLIIHFNYIDTPLLSCFACAQTCVCVCVLVVTREREHARMMVKRAPPTLSGSEKGVFFSKVKS
jgi:hypothetical protein